MLQNLSSTKKQYMKRTGVLLICFSALIASCQTSNGGEVPTSVNATLVLDAAGPEQRSKIGAIYLLVCPSVGAGTSFLLDSGLIATNAHVVASCNEQNLIAITATNQKVTFSRIVVDKQRDLALLVPSKPLGSGLRLARKDNPEPGTIVSTWGYPLLYNGSSPLLSVGYISGFRQDQSSGRAVKHIIVNGAFNHGNSGGPLLVARSNEVIGVVVLTFHFYPPEIRKTIDFLAKQNWGMMMGQITGPDGKPRDISEAQVTAMILDEFYNKTQVMIGEAIAASELVDVIKEHSSELPKSPASHSKARAANLKAIHASKPAQ